MPRCCRLAATGLHRPDDAGIARPMSPRTLPARFIAPCLPTTAPQPPSGAAWLSAGEPQTAYDRITQPCWIALAVLGQLDYALGNHKDAGIIAINQAQGAQGILECRRDRHHVFGREERAVLLQYRPDRHECAPQSAKPLPSLAQMARGVCLIGDSLSAPGDCRGADGRCADAAGIARPCRAAAGVRCAVLAYGRPAAAFRRPLAA